MCGIVGYRGKDEAAEKVFTGLKKLEYRGYDSAGIATAGNPTIKTEKGVGTIDEVTDAKLDGTTGIGHTRWATHGGVTQHNAHPHTDCKNSVAVVHNGIIENYTDLKEELEHHEFRSETDTEVIPHLLEEELENTSDLKEAAERVMVRLEGSYAVVAVLETGEMVAFKKESPLAIGLADEEIFLASDVTPFLEHTDQAVFLEDDDLVVVEEDYQVYNSGEKIEREVTEIEWDAEQASKEGHNHFMEKEIKEQPKTVKRAVFQDTSDLERAVEMMDEADKIYVTGCGTSSYAASLGARYLRNAGYHVIQEQSHELEYRAEEVGENDLVIGISQSGETADLLSFLDEIDAPVLSVVNVVGSTLARKAEHTLYINAGPEIGVASTKAFTSQLAVMKMLEYAAKDEIDEGRDHLLDTADRIETVLENNLETIEEISDYLLDHEHVYFIGREKGFDVAREASLKLKELSYIHSEAFPGGEFKHGTIALVEEGTPVVAFMNRQFDDIFSNAKEAESRGADIIAVGPPELEGFEHHLEVEGEDAEILEVAIFQMVAYLTAVKKGHNPDKPRNLAKSVTVK